MFAFLGVNLLCCAVKSAPGRCWFLCLSLTGPTARRRGAGSAPAGGGGARTVSGGCGGGGRSAAGGECKSRPGAPHGACCIEHSCAHTLFYSNVRQELASVRAALSEAQAAASAAGKRARAAAEETSRRDGELGRAKCELSAALRQLEAATGGKASRNGKTGASVTAEQFVALKAEVAALTKLKAGLTRRVEVATLLHRGASSGGAARSVSGASGGTPGLRRGGTAAPRRAAHAGASPGLDGLLATRKLATPE